MLSRISWAALVLGALGCTVRHDSSGPFTSTTAPAATSSSSITAPPSSPAPVTTATTIPPRTKTAVVVARSGEGFLEDQGGALILHLKGSPHDRGVQYGELVGDRIQLSIAALTSYAQSQASGVPSFVWAFQSLLTQGVGSLYKPYFPQDVLDMIDGIVQGAAQRSPPVTLDPLDLVFINSVIDLAATGAAVGASFQGIFKCSGLAVWGPRTKGGKTYQHRNVDLFVGTGLESQALLIIEKPDGKKSFANATWAGMVGSVSGMNENGLALSQVWAFSRDVGIGQPWILTTRGILESQENVDGVAATFASATRTYGSNFVFADRGDGRGTPRAIALESTFGLLVAHDADDPTEDAAWQGTPIAIRLPFAVFRGDTPVTQAVLDRDYEVAGQDPRNHGGYQLRYKQTADLVTAYEQAGTLIGPDEMKAISRTIAETSGSLQCVVYENTDLALHVANSRIVPGAGPAMARDEPFHDYDFDYYLPTLSFTTDRSVYAPGDAIQLAISVANRGRPRQLDVRAVLPVTTGALATLSTGQTGTASASLVLPAGTPPGTAVVLLELVESGTQDVVDYAVVAITVS
ncbi:MAG TPA: C45 family autoproteolytic acyltransferase/hydrolase [Planctomycetota bacterium]|nr:C45 family autoproteolytic acyltransferase/hydrolase [Planctomycetota bacterium]